MANNDNMEIKSRERDYSKGKVYKIEPVIDHDEGDIYIGSTTKQYLSQRMTMHKSEYVRWKGGLRDKHIRSYDLFEKYGFENCQIVLIESVDCKGRDELFLREAYYIKSMKCVNKLMPIRTDQEKKEYNEAFKKKYYEEIKKNVRQYYDTNKEKIIEYQHKYREENPDKIRQYKKNYQEEHIDEIRERRKKYCEEHKEEIKIRTSQPITCICGSITNPKHKSRHEKTEKHLDYLKNNKIEQ